MKDKSNKLTYLGLLKDALRLHKTMLTITNEELERKTKFTDTSHQDMVKKYHSGNGVIAHLNSHLDEIADIRCIYKRHEEIVAKLENEIKIRESMCDKTNNE